jgi:predicted alpha/beta hydrolase
MAKMPRLLPHDVCGGCECLYQDPLRHELWERIAAFGLAVRLQAIAADPCPPDVIGINHYLAGERLRDFERFVRENRAACRQGQLGVHRKEDEVRLGAAE